MLGANFSTKCVCQCINLSVAWGKCFINRKWVHALHPLIRIRFLSNHLLCVLILFYNAIRQFCFRFNQTKQTTKTETDTLMGWLREALTAGPRTLIWLIDWLISWLIDWLIGWSIDWLIERFYMALFSTISQTQRSCGMWPNEWLVFQFTEPVEYPRKLLTFYDAVWLWGCKVPHETQCCHRGAFSVYRMQQPCISLQRYSKPDTFILFLSGCCVILAFP